MGFYLSQPLMKGQGALKTTTWALKRFVTKMGASGAQAKCPALESQQRIVLEKNGSMENCMTAWLDLKTKVEQELFTKPENTRDIPPPYATQSQSIFEAVNSTVSPARATTELGRAALVTAVGVS